MALFAAALSEKLSQGDIFAPDWDAGLGYSVGRVLVLNEDCDIDKPDNAELLVMAVGLATDLEPGRMQFVKSHRIWHEAPLDGSNPDSIAVLRRVRGVPRADLLARLGTRLQSMTPDGKLYLAGKVHSFLTHTIPKPPSSRISAQASLAALDANLAELAGSVGNPETVLGPEWRTATVGRLFEVRATLANVFGALA